MSTQKIKRMSKGQPQTGIQSGRRTRGRCNKGKTRNVVCVDVDVDDGKSEEYIFIDAPEFSQETLHGSNLPLKKPPNNIFINIDDDEIENCDKVSRDQECGGTSTKVSSPAFGLSKRAKKSNLFDNILHTRAKRSPVTFSKSRRTYSGKTFPSHIGLNPAYDSSSSDSDNSDCELMEGSSGNIREQWEKAALKRKMTDGVQDGHTVSDNEASGPGSFWDSPNNVDAEDTSAQHVAEPFCSTSNNNGDEDCNIPTSTSRGDDVAGDPVLDVELDEGVDQDGPSVSGNPPREAYIFHETVDIHDRGNTPQVEHLSDSEVQINMDIDHDEYHSIKETEIPVEYQFSENVCFQEVKTVPGEEDVWCYYEAYIETDFHKKTILHDEDVSLHNTKRSEGAYANYDSHMSPDMNTMNSGTPNNGKTLHTEKAELFFANDVNANGHTHHESEVSSCSIDGKEPSLGSHDKIQQEVEKQTLDTEDFEGARAQDDGNSIIVDREKLKETEEYKRAAEEEWASRQHQLQLQAEEAQRLKKRKRAEAQRILDMERRQKERLEEMRETQKKNTETINMKEHLRSEVRKELVRLELIHTDMASLLRALGIPVGTGFCPTSQEVNAAYKQAMLKFHPDRASKTDIRLQVEAEEKFKLISRLKEKLTNSTHKLF